MISQFHYFPFMMSAGLSLILLDTTDDLHSENHEVKTSGNPPLPKGPIEIGALEFKLKMK